MQSLSIDQLNQIPWISKHTKGTGLPTEPPIQEIPRLLELPFIKRPGQYSLFYIWSEIIGFVPQQKSRVLDCGCGLGQISQALWLKGHEVHACDIINYFKGSSEISFTETDLNKDFPYPSSSFDVVLISTSLHYLDNPKHFFKEASRVLNPGGILVFSAANLQSLFAKKLFVKKGQLIDYGNISRPSVLYQPYFTQFLESIGFVFESRKGSAPLNSKRLLLFKLMNFLYLPKDKSQIENYSAALIYKYTKNI